MIVIGCNRGIKIKIERIIWVILQKIGFDITILIQRKIDKASNTGKDVYIPFGVWNIKKYIQI